SEARSDAPCANSGARTSNERALLLSAIALDLQHQLRQAGSLARLAPLALGPEQRVKVRRNPGGEAAIELHIPHLVALRPHEALPPIRYVALSPPSTSTRDRPAVSCDELSYEIVTTALTDYFL